MTRRALTDHGARGMPPRYLARWQMLNVRGCAAQVKITRPRPRLATRDPAKVSAVPPRTPGSVVLVMYGSGIMF